jgi:hypothetical protein
MKDWTDNFVTYSGFGFWTIWDETQAWELGTYFTKRRAKRKLIQYAEQLQRDWPHGDNDIPYQT